MPVGGVGYGNYNLYGGYGGYGNPAYGANAAPKAPPPPPPKLPDPDDDKYDGNDGGLYYVDLLNAKLATARSPADAARIGQEVMEKMEDNKTEDGKDAPNHVQGEAGDHNHLWTRSNLKKAVAEKIQALGGNPGEWAAGNEDVEKLYK
jgi:hypothetical protein